MVMVRSPAGVPLAPGSPCPFSRSLAPVSIPGGILTTRLSGLPVARWTSIVVSPPLTAVKKGDGQVGFQTCGRRVAAGAGRRAPGPSGLQKCSRSAAVFTVAASPKDPNRSEKSMCLKRYRGCAEPRGPFRGVGPRAGGGHALERGPAMAVVKCPFLLVGQNVIRRLNFLELGLPPTCRPD